MDIVGDWLGPLIASFVFDVLLGRLISVRPKIYREGNVLVARSSIKTLIFTLGAWSRKVVVDPNLKIVHLRQRTFWGFYKTRRIEYDWIREIIYTYSDCNPSSWWGWCAYQSDDLFTVGLSLKNGELIKLYRFYGEGGWVNDSIWPDWCYWVQELEANLAAGPQETESETYANVLSGLIGVPIGNDLYPYIS